MAGYAADACVSGPSVGQRPGPYSFLISTGKERGQPTCYVCETADKPAFIVFARTASEPLGKLVAKLDAALIEPKYPGLRGWVTFLNNDATTFDPIVVKWGQTHAIARTPLGVFEDVIGPPAYRLSANADITVLLYVKQKVVANFALRTNELTPAVTDKIVSTLPKLFE
jgi:hypothetical protein